MRIFYVLQIVILIGCTSFGRQRAQSEWQELDQATKVKCAAWPLVSKAIAVRSVDPLHGKNFAFVSEYQLRTAGNSVARFIGPFDGDVEIESESLSQRKFGSGALIAGGGEIGDTMYIVLVQRDPTKTSALVELRSLEDNVIRYSTTLAFNDILAAKASINGNRIWLRLARGSAETAVEDANIHYIQLRLADAKGKSKDLVRTEFNHTWNSSAALIDLKNESDKSLVIYGEQKSPDAKSFRFFINAIDAHTGNVEEKREIEIATDANVESWRAMSYKDGFMLAIVDGDSLVGQSKLKIARINWEGDFHRVFWLKTRSLDNEHVSEPAWLETTNGATLLLPKWVDLESTIAAYAVSDSDIENTKAIGLFANGIRIVNVFRNQDSNYAVVRFRKGAGTEFNLCNLGDID